MKKIRMNCGEMGPESTVPDILGQINVQNKTQFHLDEYDEIYEGYGQRSNGYPYRQQNLYTRKLKEKEIDAAILENDWLRAVFLPGFGSCMIKRTSGISCIPTIACAHPTWLYAMRGFQAAASGTAV